MPGPPGPHHNWVLDVGEEPVTIAGDTGRLHQVAANLLANARTHTPSGTTVTVSVSRDGADAVLRVHDDGPGIDPAVSAELFERFSRADRSRARQTGGTGLGLSIVRAIVQAHHGIDHAWRARPVTRRSRCGFRHGPRSRPGPPALSSR